MKLRSLICVSAVATASAVFALDGGNVFARLKVTSDVNNSIIALPFVGCGESQTKIYVTNLVMTTGLAAGDTLMYKEGNNWYAWEIENGAWKEITTSTTKAGMTFTPAANATMLDCGKACWLIRGTPGATYLYGQVTNALPSVSVAAGTSNGLTYTLVGYPCESQALDLARWKPADAVNGDLLIVPATGATGQKTYKYNGSAWTTKTVGSTQEMKNPFTKKTVTVTNFVDTAITSVGTVTIPAGAGFMYGRKGTTAIEQLTWDMAAAE